MMVPASPTAHTSVAPLPQTPSRKRVVPLGALAQAAPFQCRVVPSCPTAQTSFCPLPHNPQMRDVFSSTGVQRTPSQWVVFTFGVTAEKPAIQTSSAALPQIAVLSTKSERCAQSVASGQQLAGYALVAGQ